MPDDDEQRSWDDSSEAYEREHWDAICRGCLGDCAGCRKYGGPESDEEEENDEE